MNARLTAWVVVSALMLGGCVAESGEEEEPTPEIVAATLPVQATVQPATPSAPITPAIAPPAPATPATKGSVAGNDTGGPTDDPDPSPWHPPCGDDDPCALATTSQPVQLAPTP
jgi:hypothetical protein